MSDKRRHYKKSESQVFEVHSALKARVYDFGLDAYNMCVIELDGKHGPVRNKVSDETFFIIDGEMTVDIEGEVIIGRKGDIIHCPAGKWRTETGKTEALAICNPPFNADDEEFG